MRVENPLLALLPLQSLHLYQLSLSPIAIRAEANVTSCAVLLGLSCEGWHGRRATCPEGKGLLLTALLISYVDRQLNFAFVGLSVDRVLDLFVNYRRVVVADRLVVYDGDRLERGNLRRLRWRVPKDFFKVLDWVRRSFCLCDLFSQHFCMLRQQDWLSRCETLLFGRLILIVVIA